MTWIAVGTVEEVDRKRRVVVTHGEEEILVVAHGGRHFALANRCIHRDREMVKGMVLRDRLVCPGHQWAFDLVTGWESVKGECQPVYDVRVDDGVVYIDPASRRVVTEPPTPPEATSRV